MATEKKVRIFVDRTPGDNNDEFIGINGRSYLLPKGQYHDVPKAVADEYQRMKEARYGADSNAERIIQENRKKERDSEAAMT